MGEAGHDQLLQETCEAIVMVVAGAIDAELPENVAEMRSSDGLVVGRQMMIDATEPGGMLNVCRLAILNVEVAPAGEGARIEYEHDKQGAFGLQRVYSIQSVRRQAGTLVLLENFLAPNAQGVREADFRPIVSEAYAQQTVLATVREWVQFRAWQLQQLRGRHA